MSVDDFDPYHFFDRYARFVETSETGRHLHGREIARLNARYVALIHANRHVLANARVLDLASHDGRFSFAALHNGAREVIGIEVDKELVARANDNFRFYDVPTSAYNFIVGDIFEDTERAGRCDVVFCFGILYHINDHMRLLTKIAEAEPRWLIIDSNIAQHEDAVIELRNPVAGPNPPPGSQLEGYPSKAALDAMLSSFGWMVAYFDWTASGLSDVDLTHDYRTGRRVTALVDCGEHLSAALREEAVRTVLDNQKDRRTQWLHVKRVAAEVGVTPQALAVWVRKAEREANTTQT